MWTIIYIYKHTSIYRRMFCLKLCLCVYCCLFQQRVPKMNAWRVVQFSWKGTPQCSFYTLSSANTAFCGPAQVHNSQWTLKPTFWDNPTTCCSEIQMRTNHMLVRKLTEELTLLQLKWCCGKQSLRLWLTSQRLSTKKSGHCQGYKCN